MDPDKLISQWWSNTALSFDCEDWIEKSYINPAPFWEGLFALHQKSKRVPIQSVLSEHYDFYQDCVLRHSNFHDVAYTYITEDNTENWTYKQLHACINYHVRKWSQHNPQSGQLIVIALPPGIEFLISLLTALRFGLTICFLPPGPLLGKNRLTRMLSSIKPQLIATLDPIREIPNVLLDPKGLDEENHQPHSFSYKASKPVQISLAFHRQEPLAFVPLDAHTMYLHALRDGLLGLNLHENNSWTAPLSCPIRTEPCSTLMTLLTGSRKVYVSDEAIKNNPRILEDERIHLLGLSSELLNLWSRTPAAPSRSLKGVYRDAMDVRIQALKSFTQLNRLDKVPRFELLMDNSLGGALFITRPHHEFFNAYLRPNPGSPWWFDDFSGSGLKSTMNFGIFATDISCKENSQKPGNLLCSTSEKSCVLAGSKVPCRFGATFPIKELEEIVSILPFVESCLILPFDKEFGFMANKFFTLLVFFNPMKKNLTDNEKMDWNREIMERISDNLGTAYLPNQIDYFPLIPKISPKGIDRIWCATQYQKGLLAKKAQTPVYQL
ncbi:MAG: hypothetical protein LLG04_15710, partial [Parachlamydia sp.]|nr:hypothetical protein [Parachlamydia sp.]